MSEDLNVPKSRPKSWRWTRNSLLIALLVFLAAWKLLPPNVVRTPVVLSRGNDTLLHEETPITPRNAVRFVAHAGALKSQNNTTVGSTESHSNPAFLPDLSLLILNGSKHLLMERVGTELLSQIKKENQFDRVEYYPAGYLPEPGAEAPDIVLELALNSIKESGMAGQALKATVTATMGLSLADSNYHVSDHLSPPVVEHNAQISIEHESTLTGIESSSARYTLQGQDIAKQLATSISGRLTTLREKYRPMPKLPGSLRPEFQATPEFDFVKRLKATCRTSTHGLMFSNETIWKFEAAEEIEPLLNAVRDELAESGWQISHVSTSPLSQVHFRATKGEEIVELFPVKSHNFMSSDVKASQRPVPFTIHYLHRMDVAELQAVVAEILSLPKQDVESLLLVRRYGNPEQQQQIIKLIEQNPPRSIDAWLAVAEVQAGSQDVDACRKSLLRATFLLRTIKDPGDYAQRIKNVVTQQKIPESDLKQVDHEILKELGIVELVAGADATAIETTSNSAASFFLADETEGGTIITVRIQTDGTKRANAPATVVILQAAETSRSWSSMSAFQGSTRLEQQCSVAGKIVSITIEKRDNDSYRVSASR